ncbi:aminopeptidase N [Cardiobacteriaceae bacterium TAE3-ERU3]|nr:aminopeptidase N [Cardiobacteriaceae bacterium TAE3-ERU3]
MSNVTTIRLADYQPPAFSVGEHNLRFVLEDGKAQVHHEQTLTREQAGAPLVLNGEALKVISIAIDGNPLPDDGWQYEDAKLTIADVPDQFTLKTVVEIDADSNKELSGLYRSNGVYCTQCEAEGFRRISFALDRPDVLATYRVRIEADKATCPILLSNGDLLGSGDLDDDCHYAEWHDPHPKPSYLFALVAGDLGEVQRSITTPHGHDIDLRIYTEHAFIDQTDFAMQALVDSIHWDEQRFNLDYDLGRFNIVAVSDFNMGAMENKSLNVFNTRYVLGDIETATDSDFHGIESVIGHEYFHNWTGNRITCRDWFQLSLKEGLTVFRDQEFSGDQGEAALERIANVNLLRRVQFAEDASPMSHPVQPQEYAAIDNFYTVTVYEKGAELIRMYHTIIGEEGFQKGMKLYVERHDGQAVRIEEFAKCMEDASGYPFSEQFFKWYTSKGTPYVQFTSDYNADSRTLTLHAKQDVKRLTPAEPLVIPVRLSLMNQDGEHYAFDDSEQEYLWLLNEAEESLEFHDVDSGWMPVWMHGFTAPIYYDYDYSDDDLVRIALHGIDGFARFEAMQTCYRRLFSAALAGNDDAYRPRLARVTTLLKDILAHEQRSAGEKALLLDVPTAASLMNELDPPLDMDAILAADKRLGDDISAGIADAADAWLQQDDTKTQPEYSVADAQIRRLRGVLMQHLAKADDGKWHSRFAEAYQQSRNMTERMSAMNALNQCHDQARMDALADFAERFAEYPLVMDKWYALQASADDNGALERIRRLSESKGFVITNPNRFRSLVGAFAQNLKLFHAKDGSGYAFVADQIRRVLTINPQLSARMLNLFAIASRLDQGRQQQIREQLESLLAVDGISVDAREVIDRIISGLS